MAERPLAWPVAVTGWLPGRADLGTENGANFEDPPPAGGVVSDPQRVAYLRDHFAAAPDSIAAGVPSRGYFVWTLLDNFEWIWGFTQRFGVVHLDHDTQQRTIKESGHFIARIAHTNALPGPKSELLPSDRET